jgi:hypothetical protein
MSRIVGLGVCGEFGGVGRTYFPLLTWGEGREEVTVSSTWFIDCK